MVENIFNIKKIMKIFPSLRCYPAERIYGGKKKFFVKVKNKCSFNSVINLKLFSGNNSIHIAVFLNLFKVKK